ncbi:uncharacterized protein LOC128278837 [Anopheles cruzii]|uniref:uncharacterized protein LOC128278837 n=1 Tax=Anopheles cruzii TaxID=68878 RepID=UPI0022EC6799|nr:uncharacterized protein LOC128278837 [Anopheles cruzii]
MVLIVLRVATLALLMLRDSRAARGIYVNNQKLDPFETDHTSPSQPLAYVSKSDLLRKDNFTVPQHYYQYLVNERPSSYIDLLWGHKNRTHEPSSLVRVTSPVSMSPVQYADELASIKNKLNKTDPLYYQPAPHQPTAPSTVPPVSAQVTPPIRAKKRPTTQPSKPRPGSVLTDPVLTPEMMTFLSRYYLLSCTLVPKPAVQPIPTTAAPSSQTTTRKTKIRHLTTRATTTTTTVKPNVGDVKRRKKPSYVYVNPPVIKRLGGVLESVYSFMENALTSTETVSEETRGGRGDSAGSAKVKRNIVAPEERGGSAEKVSLAGAIAPETASWSTVLSPSTPLDSKRFTAPDRVTISGLPGAVSTDGSKNTMTTNIQVTSEYTAATPPTVPFRKPDPDDDDESSEEESEEDYFGDRPVRRKPPKKRHRKKRPASSGSYEDVDYDEEVSSDEDDDCCGKGEGDEPGVEDSDEYSDNTDDDYDDEDDVGDGNEAGFFSGMFSTFGRFVSSLGFGGPAVGGPDDYGDYEEDRARSTTPRIWSVTRKRPTRSTSGEPAVDPVDGRNGTVTVPSSKPSSSWLSMPLVYSLLSPDFDDTPLPDDLPPSEPTTITTSTTTPIGSWFELMMPWDFFNPWMQDVTENGVSEESVLPAIPSLLADAPHPSPVTPSTSWLSHLLGGSTAETPKPKPSSGSPAQPSSYPVRPTRKVSYAGHQLWRVSVETATHRQYLDDFRRSADGRRLQWWLGPTLHGPTDVLVPPEVQQTFREYLLAEGIQFRPTIRDLGRAIAHEKPRVTRREQMEHRIRQGHSLTWYRYHRYADIVQFLDYLQQQHPQRVQLLHVGRSYEGRPLTVVRVSTSMSGPVQASSERRRKRRKPQKKRPAIFIEAGAHGREWLGPAVATWFLNHLLDLQRSRAPLVNGSEPEQETVARYDWYVLPVLNPDGYEYSHEHDRMWSKSRSQVEPRPQGVLSSAFNWWQTGLAADPSTRKCYGVDLNRNWAHGWQDSGLPGNECSEDFAGSDPFSEPETRAVRDFLATGRRNIRLFVSLHAYGQVLSYPSDTDKRPQNEVDVPSDIHEMAAVALEALSGTGSDVRYRIEPSPGPEGTAAEYARYGAGIRYSYTLTLPDTGTHGFLLPPSNIVATARDAFEIIKGMIDYT